MRHTGGGRRSAMIVIVAVLAGAALWFCGRFVYTQYMDYRVLTTNIDDIPANPHLMDYAEARGEPVFMKNCASCHGADLKGSHIRGVPDLTDHDWIYGTGDPGSIEVTITYGIRSGNPRSRNLAIMPSFLYPNDPLEKINPLTPPEVDQIAQFVRTLSGEALFEGSAYCFDCHAPDAKGDHDIGAPDLSDNIWLYGHGSYKDIVRSIEFGHQGVCPEWIHRLSPVAIRELALFIYAESHNNNPTKTAIKAHGRKASSS